MAPNWLTEVRKLCVLVKHHMNQAVRASSSITLPCLLLTLFCKTYESISLTNDWVKKHRIYHKQINWENKEIQAFYLTFEHSEHSFRRGRSRTNATSCHTYKRTPWLRRLAFSVNSARTVLSILVYWFSWGGKAVLDKRGLKKQGDKLYMTCTTASFFIIWENNYKVKPQASPHPLYQRYFCHFSENGYQKDIAYSHDCEW